MNIFYNRTPSIPTPKTIEKHLTEEGIRLIALIYENPLEVTNYINSILSKNRQQWAKILCELEDMQKDGIISFIKTGKMPSQNNLQILFPIQIQKGYERKSQNDT